MRLTPDDQLKLSELKSILEYFIHRYKLTLPDILQALGEKEHLIPASIFNEDLSVLETVVKYLKENQQLKYHAIALLIGRDERNIWHMYHAAAKKHPPLFDIGDSIYYIPASILKDPKYSALETLTRFMKDSLGLAYHEIASSLKRDQRTIWTVYNRSRKKNGKQ